MRLAAWGIPALVVGTLSGSASAQAQAIPPAAPGPAGQAAETRPATVNLDFQDAPITDVINTIAKLTGKNFLYDDRVRGNVTVISPTPVTIDEAYRVFEAILQVKGFTTVPGPGGILKIVPVRSAKESPIETLPEEQQVPDRDLYITRLIPLRYVKADAIANTLRPLVSAESNMVAYAPTNTIILTDSAANVRRLLNIISEIDVETYKEQIKVIPIQYADATELAAHLAEIFGGESPSQGGRPGARARAVRQTAGAQPPAVPGEAAIGEAGQPRFITDERTNSIIVIAPGSTIQRVEQVISLLDYKRKGTGRIHVHRLQNADAEEMAQTLASLAGGAGASPGAAATPQGGAAAAQQAAQVAELEGGVRITADAPTNSLIIQASAEGFSAIRDVIETLDIRRPQVMIEALFMEVDVDDTQALGVGLLYQGLLSNDDLDSRLVLGSDTGNVGGSDPNSSGSPVLGGLLDEITNPGSFTTAILGKTIEVATDVDGDGLIEPGELISLPVIQGIITARASDTDVHIISAPILLTADNEEAQIVVGQNIPVPSSRLQTADPSSEGGFQTSQNIERQDIGVTLRVTPQISEGDTVRLDIFQEVSDLGSEDPELGPTTIKRTVENTVYVKDAEAVMIGGIIQDRHAEGVSKVPFIGDIPIIGWFFKSTTDSTRKTNLLVILTPRIVRDPGDLERLTVEQREKFRNAARESLELSEQERAERLKAEQAGIVLPLDPDPVRREIEIHERRYPVEQLPELRRERDERERERLEELKSKGDSDGGSYLVQLSSGGGADEAVALLKRLMLDGYDGTVLSHSDVGQLVHVVQLGPFASEERAQQVAREVKGSTGLEPLVLVEP